jgi:hypothetical protein
MKGTNTYDGATMIFFEWSPYHFVMGDLDKKLKTKMFRYTILLKILGKLLHTCLHPL